MGDSQGGAIDFIFGDLTGAIIASFALNFIRWLCCQVGIEF
jgi:hypothetical protein